jgi:Ras-related C3 botulinum toxin substrate 1
MAYTLHAFLDEYTPTVFDNFSVIEDIDDKSVNVILWDTAGMCRNYLSI